MIRKIYTLLILGLCLGFAACSDDNDGLDFINDGDSDLVFIAVVPAQ